MYWWLGKKSSLGQASYLSQPTVALDCPAMATMEDLSEGRVDGAQAGAAAPVQECFSRPDLECCSHSLSPTTPCYSLQKARPEGLTCPLDRLLSVREIKLCGMWY